MHKRSRHSPRSSYMPRPRQHTPKPPVHGSMQPPVDLDGTPPGQEHLPPGVVSIADRTAKATPPTAHLACPKCGCKWWWCIVAIENMQVTGRGTDIQCQNCGHTQQG